MKYDHIAILTVMFIMALCARVSEGQDTGTWEAWGSWMTPPCPVTCGGSLRILFRTRNCLNGNCSGDGVQLNETTCGTSDCTSEFTPWGDWKNSSCTATCTRTLTRTRECSGTCVGDTVEHRVIDCFGEECSDGLSLWGEWTYGDCSGTCGVDVTRPGYRQRNCTIQQCYGNLMETKVQNCNLTQCPVHGGFSVWSVWTTPQCTVTCGTDMIGRAKRTRSCTTPSPAFGGNACSGAYEELKTQNCELDLCPVDGNWTAWSSWTMPNCPTTCGSEATVMVKRNRTCTKPSPKFGGKDCVGENEESATRKCKHEICPGMDPIIGIIIGLVVLFIIILSSVTVYCVRKYKKERTHKDTETQDTNIRQGGEQDIELETRHHTDYEAMTDIRSTRNQHNPYTDLEHANTEPVVKKLSDYELIFRKHAMEHPYTGLTETNHDAHEVLPHPCLRSSDEHTYINQNADQGNNQV